jgi:hypothetical protein
MQIDDPRALMLRLIVGELLARRGAGPLAPRHFVPARAIPASPAPLQRDPEHEPKP